MEIVPATKTGIAKAVGVLRAGGVIAYPTDTAYALGGIFDSPAVTRKVLAIKGRQDRKFTLVAASLGQVEKFFKLSPAARKLARQYWPGPLSIVVSPRFAIRVPNELISRRLARFAGRPLVATSANRSGQPAAYNARAVQRAIGNQKNQPELVVNGGKLKPGVVSTVVRVSGGKVAVIRPGGVGIIDQPRSSQKGSRQNRRQ